MNYRAVILLLAIVCSESFATSYRHVRAQTDAEVIAAAVEMIILDIGTVPEQEDWPTILKEQQEKYPGWNGPYLRNIGKDPWGNGYQLEVSGDVFVGIYSMGKNGLDNSGAEDDITSWSGFNKDIYFPNWRRDLAVGWFILSSIVLFPVFIFIRSIRKKNTKNDCFGDGASRIKRQL